MTEKVLYEVRDGVGWVTLNRPGSAQRHRRRRVDPFH